MLNINDQGVNDGVADAFAALTAAIALNQPIILDSGSYKINTNITIPATSPILAVGGVLKPANGVNIACNAAIFGVPGALVFDLSLGGTVSGAQVSLPLYLPQHVTAAENSTDSNQVVTADVITRGFYFRSNQTSRTDTTDSAVNIYAAAKSPANGSTWRLETVNRSATTLTLAGGSGVTISGTATIATNTAVVWKVIITSSAAVTITRLYSYTVGA